MRQGIIPARHLPPASARVSVHSRIGIAPVSVRTPHHRLSLTVSHSTMPGRTASRPSGAPNFAECGERVQAKAELRRLLAVQAERDRASETAFEALHTLPETTGRIPSSRMHLVSFPFAPQSA